MTQAEKEKLDARLNLSILQENYWLRAGRMEHATIKGKVKMMSDSKLMRARRKELTMKERQGLKHAAEFGRLIEDVERMKLAYKKARSAHPPPGSARRLLRKGEK